MSVHLNRELQKLRKSVLSLSAMVEENVSLAVKSLEERNEDLSARVTLADDTIDQTEVEVEEECLKILALHQPVATDLRFIISILKINDNLERIGDLAVNISNKADRVAENGPPPVNIDFMAMSTVARTMLKEAIDALVNLDGGLARKVCASDDQVDQMKRAARDVIHQAVKDTPDKVECLMALLGATRNIERIADLATNIAEDVVYMTEGKIIRHGGEDTD